MLTTRPTPKIILFFLLMVLFLPTVDLLFKVDPFASNNEKRELAKFPGVPKSLSDLQKFPREYTAYINDNFGFRNALLIGNYLNKYSLLRSSPSDQVLIGQNGWLYYAGDGEINDSRHVSRLTEAQLRRMVMSYEIKRQWLAAQGIRYLLVIAPNKSTSYSEYLPATFNMVRPESVVDDLKGYIVKHSSVSMIDSRDMIKNAKNTTTLYYKYDSHWNNHGAFIAYLQIMQQLRVWFPDINVLSLGDFLITKKIRKAGDFAQMVGGGKFITDDEYVFTPKQSFCSTITQRNVKPRDPFTMENNNIASHNVVVFRDSFFSALVPFISESFKLSRYFWQSWDSQVNIKEIVKQYKPDIVIEEVAERFIKFELNDITRHQPTWAFDFWQRVYANSNYPVVNLNLDSLTSAEQVTTKKSSSGLQIKSIGTDPQLVFDKVGLNYSSEKNRLIRVIVTAPAETDLQLYFKNKSDIYFAEEKSIKAHLKKGKNEIYLPLMFAGDIDALRLDPATVSGEFMLQSIEIRQIDDMKMK